MQLMLPKSSKNCYCGKCQFWSPRCVHIGYITILTDTRGLLRQRINESKQKETYTRARTEWSIKTTYIYGSDWGDLLVRFRHLFNKGTEQ